MTFLVIADPRIFAWTGQGHSAWFRYPTNSNTPADQVYPIQSIWAFFEQMCYPRKIKIVAWYPTGQGKPFNRIFTSDFTAHAAYAKFAVPVIRTISEHEMWALCWQLLSACGKISRSLLQIGSSDDYESETVILSFYVNSSETFFGEDSAGMSNKNTLDFALKNECKDAAKAEIKDSLFSDQTTAI